MKHKIKETVMVADLEEKWNYTPTKVACYIPIPMSAINEFGSIKILDELLGAIK